MDRIKLAPGLNPADFTPTATQMLQELAEEVAKKPNNVTANVAWKSERGFALFTGTVVEAHPAAGPTMAHLVFGPQETFAFVNKQLDLVPALSPGNQIQVTDDMTTLVEPQSLQETSMSIDAASMGATGYRISYTPTSGSLQSLPVVIAGESISDPVIAGLYLGTQLFRDPSSLASPATVDAPFNLETVILEALRPVIEVAFKWGRKNERILGTSDSFPEGMAKSYLHTSGVPSPDSRFYVPEGFRWGKDGERGAGFSVRFRTYRPIVIPIPLNTQILGATPGTQPIPQKIQLEVRFSVHGPQFWLGDGN